MSSSFYTDLDFDPSSWVFTTDWGKKLDTTSEAFLFENVDSEIDELFSPTQMETSNTPPSKKRSYSACSSEENESRKKMKVESLLSPPSAKIDLLGAKLFNPDQYPQCTKEELNLHRTAAELEMFEKWIDVDPPKISDDHYYTAQTVTVPGHLYNRPEGSITILTGKLDRYSIPAGAPEALRYNLKTAKLIIDLVGKAIPFSDNFLQRSRLFTQKCIDRNCFSNLRNFLIESSKDLFTKVPLTCPLRPLENRVEEILMHKTANCGHLTMVGYYFSKKFVSVDWIAFKEPRDHGCLLFGRNKAFPVSDYKNWGPYAVVCDIWTRAFFPACESEKHLMDCKGQIYDNGIQWTVVGKLDPSAQLYQWDPGDHS